MCMTCHLKGALTQRASLGSSGFSGAGLSPVFGGSFGRVLRVRRRVLRRVFGGSRVRRGPSASLEGLLNFSPGPWRVLRRVLRRVSRPSSLAGSSAGLRRVFARSFAAGLSASLGVPRRLSASLGGLSPVFRRSFAGLFPRLASFPGVFKDPRCVRAPST